jgi:serine/threonine protein kinase
MPSDNSTEHNLLFGILALHAGLVDGDSLVEAIDHWAKARDRQLCQVLVDRGVLNAADESAVEALVARNLARHDNDAARSLDHLGRLGSGRQVLDRVDVAGLQTGKTPSAATRPDTLVGPPGCDALPGAAGAGAARYRILRSHARGGLGEVFVARDEELNRDVALKEIQPRHAYHPGNRGRFLLEAEITARLEHPGIVPVYGLGAYPDGRPFYAMRFIEGHDLKDAVTRFHAADTPGRDPGERRLAFRELLGRFVDVCNAVAFAHSKGVLHRDLKPGNVMLGKYGETLVVDWGLAKAIGQSGEPSGAFAALSPRTADGSALTQAGATLGTPAYMSPEQAAGQIDRLGVASDIYGLGATLFTLLTGRVPTEGEEGKGVLHGMLAGEVVPPRRVKSDTPAALDAICRKAMALRPEDRYASALELASEVERWLADEPVWAYREPWNVRAGRWLRRHRQLMTSLAALVVAALPLLSVIAVNREQARRQARRAEEEIGRQKEIAEANERTASEREAEARAVLDFVESKVFAAARPTGVDGGLGRDVTLRMAVDDALPFVANSFANQPLIEARLRKSLGTSFLHLGEPAVAAEQFEIARKLYTEHLGPNHRDTLASMNGQAQGYSGLSRHADAVKLFEETLALQKAALGPNDPDTLTTMAWLSTAYFALGRYADALRLREETLALRKTRLGPDHPDTLASMHNLANSLGSVGRQEDARRLAEETMRRTKAVLGPDHPRTLWTMHNLANVYVNSGRPTEALELFQKTLELRKARLGADHPDTLTGMSDLAICYRALNRPADALELNKKTLELRKSKLGADHSATLASMNNLAASYEEMGRHSEALALNQETFARMKAKLGPDHPYTLMSMSGVAESLVNVDRGAEAVPVIDELVRRASGRVVDPSLLPDVISLRSRYFAKVHDAAGCRATAEMWEKLGRTDADSLYNAACFRAVTAGVILGGGGPASEAGAEADRAVSWLRQAVAAGFKSADTLKKDKELDALRGRDDFKQLLTEVERRAGKSSP